jgi:hypothetical protein
MYIRWTFATWLGKPASIARKQAHVGSSNSARESAMRFKSAPGMTVSVIHPPNLTTVPPELTTAPPERADGTVCPPAA